MRAENHYPSVFAAMGTLVFVLLSFGVFMIAIGNTDRKFGVLMLGIGATAFSVVPFLYRILQVKNRYFVVENGLIKYHVGIIESTDMEIKTTTVNAVIVRRSIFHKLFGGAEIGIACQGVGGPVAFSSNDVNQIKINDIKNYQEVVDAIKNDPNQSVKSSP